MISTSYGDDEITVPIEYAKRVCNSFAQLGARGVSLLFSSGDGGAGGIAGNNASACISNDGKNTFQFLPSFPASCPYVTAVGATQGFEPETSASRPATGLGPEGKPHGYYASGSGFSNYFTRPKYQDHVVDKYVKRMNGEHKGLFNPGKLSFCLKPSQFSADPHSRWPSLSRSCSTRSLLQHRVEPNLQNRLWNQRFISTHGIHRFSC